MQILDSKVLPGETVLVEADSSGEAMAFKRETAKAGAA